MKCKKYKYKILKGPNYGKWGTEKDFINKTAIAIDCGKCSECRMKRIMKWKSKMEMEAITNQKQNGTMYFITLTYDNNNIKKIESNTLMSEVQKWIKRQRNNNKNLKLKYFGVSELGSETARKHHHLLLYCNYDYLTRTKGTGKRIHNNLYYQAENINWNNGYHSIAKLGKEKTKTINYILKYVLKNPLNYFYSKSLGKEEMLERGNQKKGTYLLNGYTFKITGHKEWKTNEEIIELNYESTKTKEHKNIKPAILMKKEIEPKESRENINE